MASGVEGLIEQLRAGGALDGEGGFTLDREKARQKLRQFQLADPRSYVLLLVSAAVLRGATRIDFRIDADDVHLRFDRSFDAADLDALYSSLFGAHDDPSLRPRQELALALNAAMALDPAHATVESANEAGLGVRLTVRPEDSDDIETEVPGVDSGTHVHVKDRFRARTVLRFFRNIGRSIAEERYLRERCTWSPIPITLDGREITKAPESLEALAQTVVDVPGGRAWIALVDESGPSEVELVLAGVSFGPQVLAEGPRGPRARALVQTTALRKDVSQTAIVRDRDHDAVLRALRPGLLEVTAMVLRRVDELYGGFFAAPEPLQEHVRGLFVALGDAVLAPAEASIHRVLAELPAWRTLGDGVRSITELASERRAFDYLTKRISEALPAAYARLVVVDDPSWLQAFRSVARGRGVDRTAEVERWVRRERARRAFLARHHPPRVGETSCRIRLGFRSGQIEGEVALLQDRSSTSRFVIVVDGLALWELSSMQLPIGGLVVVVQAPVRPTADYDRAERDEVLARALLTAAAAVHGAMNELATLASEEAGIASRRDFLEYLRICLAGGLEARILQAFGFEPERAIELLAGHEPHPLAPRISNVPSDRPWAHAALFRTADGRSITLAEIELGRSPSGAIFVVASSRPSADDLPHLVLRADAREVAILQAMFGEDKVIRWDGPYQRLLSQRARRALPPDPLEPRFPCAVGPRTFELSGARIAVGLEAESLPPPIEVPKRPGDRRIIAPRLGRRRSTARASVRVQTDGRDVCDVDLPCPVGRVTAALDVDDLETNVDQTELAGRATRLHVARLLHEGVVRFLGSVATDVRDDAERHALLEAMGAFVSGQEWIAAHRRLRASCEPAGAREELGTLFDLIDRFGQQLVDAALRHVLGSEVLPTASAVQEEIARRREVGEVPSIPLAPLRRGLLGISAMLEHAPLFRTLTGVTTLAAVWDELGRRGRVAYVRMQGDPIGRETTSERLVLQLAPADRVLLERLLGTDALEDVTGARELAGRPERALELSADEALVSMTIDQSGMRGQLGLPLEHPQAATTSITVCHRRRPITQISPRLPAPMVGVVDGERFGVHTGFERLRSTEEDQVARLCQRSFRALWKALADEYEALEPERRPLADAWVLHALRIHGQGSGARRSRVQGGVEVLLDLPVLQTLGGGRISFEALRRVHGQRLIPVCHDPDLPLATDPVVLVDRTTVEVLEAVFGQLGDYAQLVSNTLAEQEWQRARMGAAPRLPEPPGHALLVEPVSGCGLEGRLWIDPGNLHEARVAFGSEGKVVTEAVVSELLACSGAIEGSGLQVAEGWDQVEVDPRRRELLLRTVVGMYDALADRHRAELTAEVDVPDPSLRERLRNLVVRSDRSDELARVLRLALARMHAEVRQGRVWSGERHIELYRKLRELPLLDLANGRRISLEVALRERPMELDDDDLWDAFCDGASAREQRAGLLSRARIIGSVLDSGTRAPAEPAEAVPEPEPEAVPEPEPEAVPEPEPTSRETLLLDAIRAELRMVRMGNLALVDDAHLDMLHFAQSSSPAAVYVDEGQLALNRRHRVVELALEHSEQDPIWISFLVSAVYSTLNAWLAEITDADELGFHRAHALHVASERPA
jgi:hypothetical protein